MDKFHPDSYLIEKTGVKIETDDSELRFLIERAEDICEKNKASFCGIPVLREGAKYDGVWLETQPMGGEMYASRDAVTALGNHLIFMKYQRRDGKMPGMISVSYPFKGVTPHHDWMQGDFFSPSALRMYYLIGRDKKYLSLLYTAIKEFDEYLWEFRDTDGDGCLETFCTWDTGDDNNTRLLTHGIGAHEHGCARSEKAPEKTGDMPFESAEYMAYSYSQRSTLAKISDILENGEGDIWRERAEAVRRRFCEYLWDKDTAAAYDRDKNNEMMYTLSLENIKCMYHGIFTQKMADEFISRHLMNPEEFFTPLPLPNIAANDPCFFLDEKRNNLTEDMLNTVLSVCASDISNNSWSGPAQGLCHQRVIDALLGYGHHAELSIIGRKWIDNIKRRKIFAQQYNPFTGECEEGKDGYGPTVLSALEYIAHLIGIDYASERFTFSSGVAEADSIYTQKIFGNTYLLSRKSGQAILTKNGEEIFTFTPGVRIITNEALDILEVVGMESEPQEVVLTVADKEYRATVGPNEVFAIEDGELKLIRKVPFSNCNRV
jgi:hypothetical protein